MFQSSVLPSDHGAYNVNVAGISNFEKVDKKNLIGSEQFSACETIDTVCTVAEHSTRNYKIEGSNLFPLLISAILFSRSFVFRPFLSSLRLTKGEDMIAEIVLRLFWYFRHFGFRPFLKGPV